MEVPKERLNKILELYHSRYHYLKEAHYDYLLGKGKFIINKTNYVNPKHKDVKHLANPEAQICLNQLCYVFFGEEVLEKRYKEMENFSYEEYINRMMEEMLIIKSNISFKKAIDKTKGFNGEIKLNKIRKIGNLYLAFLDFDFEQKACFGKLELGLKLN